ncbi:MAG: BrnT family toxin [Desulfobacterales bacterium]|nr:BrnT family toxin [Desulfobacterales bacterium]
MPNYSEYGFVVKGYCGSPFFNFFQPVGEHRYITIGFSSRGRLLVVGYTERGEALRIINARPATAHERKKHEGQT